MVTQFNSFYQALLIFSAAVLSTIGVHIGLLVRGDHCRQVSLKARKAPTRGISPKSAGVG